MNSVSFYKLISEPIRIRILYLLSQSSLSVSELVQILNASQSNISHHIKLLLNDRLIYLQKFGNINLYSLNKSVELSSSASQTFKTLEPLAKELGEFDSDYTNLLKQLQTRDQDEIRRKWASWRGEQPDIPYTFQFALEGLKDEGCALDLGCGDGNFTKIIKNNFKQVVAVEIVYEQLESLQSDLPNNVACINANAMQLPFKNKSFDVIYIRMVYQFITDKTTFLSNALSCLKPEGRLVMIDTIDTEGYQFSKAFIENEVSSISNITGIEFEIQEYKNLAKVFICTFKRIN